jgi:uncharacterized protein YyaL (SSP411 family)
MHRLALNCPLPRRVVRFVAQGQELPAKLPAALREMAAAGSGTRAYACSGSTCQAPALSPAQWQETLSRLGTPSTR